MLISVIMPIYNAQEHLKKSLESILNQSYRDIEPILINDGSRDASLEICRAYKARDERIVLLDIPNSGPGAARNMGLSRASGEYIVFVDADDYLREDFFERLVGLLQGKRYDIVACNHFRVDHRTRISKNTYTSGEIDRYGRDEEKERYRQFKTSSSFGYVWGKFYKRSFIRENKIEFSQEKKVFLEDTLFNLKLFFFNPQYYILNEPFYYYNVYDESISNKREDITARAIKLLEDYEKFLDQEGGYEENLDLFVPLASRVIAWSLFKTMDHSFTFKNIYDKLDRFSNTHTIKRLFSHKRSLKELRKIDSKLQSLFYSSINMMIRYGFKRSLTLVFYTSYPLFKLYIKRAVKS